MPAHSLRHMPWTCRWGHFGGPVTAAPQAPHGFVFWVCMHPTLDHPRVPDRGACESCPLWEAGEQFREADVATVV